MTAVDDLKAAVDAALDDFPILESPDGESPPLLASLDEAVHVGRSLRSVVRKRSRLEAAAKVEIDRLKAEIATVEEWLAQETKGLSARAEYLSGLLEAYALDQRARGRGKTLSTPCVRVSTREVDGAWSIGDEAVAWTRTNRPDLLKVVESVPVAAAKGAWVVTEQGVIDLTTGELVPGVEVAPARVTATVKVIDAAVPEPRS